MDCFWTMWVLSFPNLSAIVPPNIQSTIPSSYFQACSIPFQQIFRKADVFKQNTRLGGESWKDLRLPCQARKRAAKWISLSHNFARHSHLENSLSLRLTISCWEESSDSHLGGLRPCGRPGPTAAVWLICVKMARSAPKPMPRKNPDGSRLPRAGGQLPPSPLGTLKPFSLLEPLPTPFQERLPRSQKLWTIELQRNQNEHSRGSGATLLNTLRVVFRKKVTDSKHGFHQR